MPASDPTDLLIRALAPGDRGAALAVINAAAEWYREFLPPEELHGPEMTPASFEAEARRMTWYGAFAGGDLVGVMGLEYVGDVALLRHAYVLPDRQRRGVGTLLREHAEAQVRGVAAALPCYPRGSAQAIRRVREAHGDRRRADRRNPGQNRDVQRRSSVQRPREPPLQRDSRAIDPAPGSMGLPASRDAQNDSRGSRSK